MFFLFVLLFDIIIKNFDESRIESWAEARLSASKRLLLKFA